MEENTNKEEAESLEEEREEINDLKMVLNSIYAMLDDLWFKTWEIEEAEAVKTDNLDTFSERISSLVSKLTERADQAGVALAEKQTTIQDLETKLAEIQAELDTLKAEKAQAELEAKTAKRESALAEIGIELNDTNKDRFLEFSDSDFEFFVESLKAVRNTVGGKSAAETKIKLPDPVTNTEITTEDIVKAHNELVKKGK